MVSKPRPSSLPSSLPPLTRSLSASETWGFGLTGLLVWPSIAPPVIAALGLASIQVWLPAILVGMLTIYQVKQLGRHWLDVSGGTPCYAAKLLKPYPTLASYVALGYFFSWVSTLPISAIVLTDLIQANFQALGLDCPTLLFKLGFTLITFILAFSGTRALSILHLFFVLPAIALLLTFCLQGLGWLALSHHSPGLFIPHPSYLNLQEWMKWYFFVSYAGYACETASAYVADSRNPQKTLNFLPISAALMPPIFLGGAWVLSRLATDGTSDPFLSFVQSARYFWGDSAPLLITFLISAVSLLSCATVVSNCPRILYQLAHSGNLSPVFGIVSRRGVFTPGLILILVLSLLCLSWGNVAQIVAVGNVGWFTSFMGFRLGLWLQREQPQVVFPRLALGILCAEVVILFWGGISWGWQDFLMGCLFPLGILIGDRSLRLMPLAVFHPRWWLKQDSPPTQAHLQDSILWQVMILILLLCCAVLVGWNSHILLNPPAAPRNNTLIVVLLQVVVFVGVAIACWTSLPQVVALSEARDATEHLFKIAQDAIMVVNDQGIIQKVNPAAELMFQRHSTQLINHHLNRWLPELEGDPQDWVKGRTFDLISAHAPNPIAIEVSVSNRQSRDYPEYVVILRDVSERIAALRESQQALSALRQSETQLREKAKQLKQTLQELQQTQAQLVQTEKMSSLGQMVAGVAHEINNPVNFIYGNINHATEYIQDLLELVERYQSQDANPAEIQALEEEIDLEFIKVDLPKLLASIKLGANRIKDIVQALRSFSRLDEAEVKEVDIHEGIDSTLMILQNRLKKTPKHSEIEVIKAYGDLPLVECYPGQLNQVLMNILVNGIEALDSIERHETSSKTPQIEISTQLSRKDHILIRIKDNGPGIPEGVMNRLFDPFFTTKPIGQGTGLGLSISYSIITNKHHGSLSCYSQFGEGAEFVIDIPIHQDPKPSDS